MVKPEKFNGALDVRVHGLRQYETLSEISFYVSDEKKDDCITVPIGFRTDLATVPRLLWVLFPPVDRYVKAAVIHDYMYENALRTKAEADLIFLEGMRVLGVNKFKRMVMYYAVKLFGKGNYKGGAMK